MIRPARPSVSEDDDRRRDQRPEGEVGGMAVRRKAGNDERATRSRRRQAQRTAQCGEWLAWVSPRKFGLLRSDAERAKAAGPQRHQGRHRLVGPMPQCGGLRCDPGYTPGSLRPALDRGQRQCHLPPVSRPDGRSGKGRKAAGEESPGSTETRCRLTAGGGDPRESATESKPPGKAFARRRVRVKGWGKSPPRDRQRTGTVNPTGSKTE